MRGRCCSCTGPARRGCHSPPPRNRAQQAAYNRQLQEQFESTRRVAPTMPMTAPDRVNDLKKLGELYQSGVLTHAEFESAKARLLAR